MSHQSKDEIHFLCFGQRSDCVVQEHWKQLCVQPLLTIFTVCTGSYNGGLGQSQHPKRWMDGKNWPGKTGQLLLMWWICNLVERFSHNETYRIRMNADTNEYPVLLRGHSFSLLPLDWALVEHAGRITFSSTDTNSAWRTHHLRMQCTKVCFLYVSPNHPI